MLLVLIIIGIGLFLSPFRGTFYSSVNVQNVLIQTSLLTTFAIGETIVIITAGIDLSLGSLIAFSGMVLAMSLHRLVSAVAVPGAICITLAVCAAIGAIHTLFIARLRLPAFVVTLASLTLLRSQSLLVNRQLPIPIDRFTFFNDLSNGQFFYGKWYAIPKPAVLVAVIAVIAHVALTRTRVGRYVYSVGSNAVATRLSGVSIPRVLLFAYGVSAVLGGVAGILYAGYGGQGDPLSGQGYELNAVAAAVIGGANLMGGEGSVAGTVLGAMLLQVILSAINLTIPNPSLWQGTVVGGVLLLAVLVTALQQRRRAT